MEWLGFSKLLNQISSNVTNGNLCFHLINLFLIVCYLIDNCKQNNLVIVNGCFNSVNQTI